jgi:AraC family transcriptional regulator of adaptative response / DNA-3-methyladenine glycosylase II
MRETYGTSPSELRNGSVRPPGLSLRLSYRGPYEAEPLLGFLSKRAIPGVESITEERYSRTIPGGVIELIPGDGHVLLRAEATGALRGVAKVVARCRRLFDLDADPDAVGEVLSADPLLAPLVAAAPGLRVPGAYDGFELAVRAVLGQQVSVAGARTLAGRLVERAGSPLAQPQGDLTHVFPTAEAVAEADLTGLGLTGARERTLRAVAEAVASGELDLDGGGDLDETAARLLEIPGIGPWTVAYIRMRALRDPDAFPGTDLVLGRVLDRHGLKPSVTDAWRPWRAYAALHLWNNELLRNAKDIT